jgi:glutamate:GABA antiporter
MAGSKKTLSLLSLVMINVIAIDNIRSLPFGAIFGKGMLACYGLVILTFLIPSALITMELATAWPNKGGLYVWVREAFGESYGFVCIWLQWICNIIWYPAMLMFLLNIASDTFHIDILSHAGISWLAIVGLFALASLANLPGMAFSGRLSTIAAVIGTLLPMLFLTLSALWWWHQGRPLALPLESSHWIPDMKALGHNDAFLGLFFGLIGIEMSAVHADEVKDPEKTFPAAVVYSLLLIVLSLIASSYAIAMVLPADQLSLIQGIYAALARFCQATGLAFLLPYLMCCIILGGLGNLATWIIGPSKGLMVAIQDGNRLTFLAKTNKAGVPLVILGIQLIMVALLSALLLAFPTNTVYSLLTVMAAEVSLLVYVLFFAAAGKLRQKYPHRPRPFRISSGFKALRFCQLLGTLSCLGFFVLGMLPPQSVSNPWQYELSLLLGMLALMLPAIWVFHNITKPTP